MVIAIVVILMMMMIEIVINDAPETVKNPQISIIKTHPGYCISVRKRYI